MIKLYETYLLYKHIVSAVLTVIYGIVTGFMAALALVSSLAGLSDVVIGALLTIMMAIFTVTESKEKARAEIAAQATDEAGHD